MTPVMMEGVLDKGESLENSVAAGERVDATAEEEAVDAVAIAEVDADSDTDTVVEVDVDREVVVELDDDEM